jgi:RNase P subunit RPR2
MMRKAFLFSNKYLARFIDLRERHNESVTALQKKSNDKVAKEWSEVFCNNKTSYAHVTYRVQIHLGFRRVSRFCLECISFPFTLDYELSREIGP